MLLDRVCPIQKPKNIRFSENEIKKKHFCISGVMLAHAMADVGCRIIAFARDIHAVAKLLQTVFLHK